jgi:hypothetical protein
MLNTYCVGCHNTRAKTGGLALDTLNLQAAADDAQIWEKALHKLRGHLMPPPGNPQPPQKDVDSFVDWMENRLDSQAKGPKAGYVPIQRLNRTEYVATVQHPSWPSGSVPTLPGLRIISRRLLRVFYDDMERSQCHLILWICLSITLSIVTIFPYRASATTRRLQIAFYLSQSQPKFSNASEKLEGI